MRCPVMNWSDFEDDPNPGPYDSLKTCTRCGAKVMEKMDDSRAEEEAKARAACRAKYDSRSI